MLEREDNKLTFGVILLMTVVVSIVLGFLISLGFHVIL